MQSSGVPGALRRVVFREGRYRCKHCGLTGREERFDRGGYGYPTATPSVFLSIDHIIPRSRGGTSERSNLQVLCTLCNLLKGTRMPGEHNAARRRAAKLQAARAA